VRYQDQPVLKGDRGDLQIMRADHRAEFFEFMSDHRAFPRAIIIERQRNERLEKHIQFAVLANRIGTAFGTVTKLIDHDGTENDIADLVACQRSANLMLQQRNARVGIGEKRHSSGSRCSN
jgi:hypothetical protein